MGPTPHQGNSDEDSPKSVHSDQIKQYHEKIIENKIVKYTFSLENQPEPSSEQNENPSENQNDN